MRDFHFICWSLVYGRSGNHSMATTVTKFPLLPEQGLMRRTMASSVNGLVINAKLPKDRNFARPVLYRPSVRGCDQRPRLDQSLPPISPGTSGEDGGITSGYHSEATETKPLPAPPAAAAAASGTAPDDQRYHAGQMHRPQPAEQHNRHHNRELIRRHKRERHERQVQMLTAESDVKRQQQLQERLRWGDRGIGCTRLWQPAAGGQDLPGSSRDRVPMWVRRAGDNGQTVEVEDRSPSAVSCQSQVSQQNGLLMLPMNSDWKQNGSPVGAAHERSTLDASLCWDSSTEQFQAEYKRRAAVQILLINQQQAAEKRLRARAERQQQAREEAAALQYMQREQLRLRHLDEQRRRELAGRLEALERRQQSVLLAVQEASRQAAVDRRQRLLKTADGGGAMVCLRSSRSHQNVSADSDELRVVSVRSSSAEQLPVETPPATTATTTTAATATATAAAAAEHLFAETECEDGHRADNGRTVATQTDSQRLLHEANNTMPQRTRNVKVGTDLLAKYIGFKGNNLMIDRPRWNAPKKDKLYLTQSEKDVTLSRRCRRRGLRRALRSEDTASDTDTDTRGRFKPAALSSNYSRNSYPEQSLYSRSLYLSEASGIDTALPPYYLPTWHCSSTYPPPPPPRHNLPAPLLPPVSRCRSLPRLHYPFVSTERALCDVNGTVCDPSRDTGRRQRSPLQLRSSHSRRDNGTDKEDEEPPLLQLHSSTTTAAAAAATTTTDTDSRETKLRESGRALRDRGEVLCDTLSDMSPDTVTSTPSHKASPDTASSGSPSSGSSSTVKKQLSKLKNSLMKSRRQVTRVKKVLDTETG